MEDFGKGRAAMMTYIRLKTDYLQRLPWMLCALAHLDESVARRFGEKCRAAWLRDPRPQAHHRVTCRWMMDGGALRTNLDRFIGGARM